MRTSTHNLTHTHHNKYTYSHTHNGISFFYSILLQSCLQSSSINISVMSPLHLKTVLRKTLFLITLFILSYFILCYLILRTNREKEDCKNKMSHLQEAVRTHFSSLTSLKQQAAQYRQEKEGENQIFHFYFYYTVWYSKFILSLQSLTLLKKYC